MSETKSPPTAKAAAKRKKPPSEFGNILTVKNLSPRAYNAIHSLPHGFRQEVLRALLEATAKFAKARGKDWYKDVVAGRVEVR